MQKTIVYDKAKYHIEGTFPKELPVEQAYVHTGMFLGWLIDNNLHNREFFEQLGIQKDADAFMDRRITGTQIFMNLLDGSLTNDDLNDEGNKFTKYYFDIKKWPYMKDYMKTLGHGLPSEYHVKDSWENYDKLTKVIDKQYADWKRKKGKKFWEFWK